MTFSASLLCNIMFTTLVRVATHVGFTTLVRVTHSNPSFPPVPLFCELYIYIYFVQCAERVGWGRYPFDVPITKKTFTILTLLGLRQCDFALLLFQMKVIVHCTFKTIVILSLSIIQKISANF